MLKRKAVRKGWGLGLNPPPWIWYVTKFYYLRKGDWLFSHTFCLLIYRLNANNTEWFYHVESRPTVYLYLDFGLKNSSFRLPYQRPSSSADCVSELFKGSNGSASLVDCTGKKFFGWGVRIFCEWRHKWSSFRVILAHVTWPRAQPLRQNVSLKFSLETRLESESFEPLIDFLAFLVQNLWFEINKLINYLISWLVKYFY